MNNDSKCGECGACFEEWDYTKDFNMGCHKNIKNLQSLRSVAAREIMGAVYAYFLASIKSSNEIYEDGMTYQEYFAHEAADEMLHYLDEIRLVSKYDPYQRKEFEEHGLGDYLVGDEYPPITFWYGPFPDDYIPDAATVRWLNSIDEAIKGIVFELETISKYENLISEETKCDVIKVYIEAMNHEKGDLADFNDILFKLLYTDDPMPPIE